jgi:methylmalonyl-CoA epimerase
MITKINHVGIVVRNAGKVALTFSNLFGFEVSQELVIPGQFKSALISKGDAIIELIEPIGSEGTIARFLEKKGGGLHHISLEVNDIDEEIKSLKAKGVQLLSEVPIQATKEARVIFIHPSSAEGTLIELIERR